jgi:hypothetical protein
MVRLAGRALDVIADERPGRHLERLPAEGQVPGSARLIRGPYALQSIVTLGEGDILRLGGRTTAVAADYRTEGGSWTLILVPYPDEAAAKASLAHLRRNLDSYLEVVRERAGGFVFKDFKSRFGEVRLTGSVLNVKLDLVRLPG